MNDEANKREAGCAQHVQSSLTRLETDFRMLQETCADLRRTVAEQSFQLQSSHEEKVGIHSQLCRSDILRHKTKKEVGGFPFET